MKKKMNKKGAMDVDEVLKKYSKKINSEVQRYDYNQSGPKADVSSVSKDYGQFKTDMMPELSRYERWCRGLGGFIKVKPSVKESEKINKDLAIAHLDLTSQEVAGLAIFSFVGIFIFAAIVSIAIFFISGKVENIGLFFLLMLIMAVFSYYYFSTMPARLAVKWKLKASSQMVPAILYTVIYMKHTSNLERAISFVSQHVDAPLALDFRKILWDVETGKFSSLKDSLDAYLDFWRDSNMEFVESFHLIESSLFEPSDARRIQILERALRVILDGVYEKMLKYTHTIKAPLTNLYMLGITLPTLGLPLIVLASTLLGGLIQAIHLFVLFNIIVPFFVFYLTMQIMIKRPGGYGETSLLEKNPFYNKYISKKPYYVAGLICAPFFILGLLPLIVGYTPIPQWLGFTPPYDFAFSSLGISFFSGNFFGFRETNHIVTGPFGLGSVLLSLLIPFSVAMFFALSYRLKTKELIKARDSTKDLEEEFNSSLFTLGNRLGDGTPAEIAFVKVADSLKGQKTEDFFRIVNTNIQSMGMGLEEAIFNNKRGAIIYYPSSLIATSMRILIESAKKGLTVAAESLMSISEYVRNIQKINERLRDLLADVVSDMKSNMTFLAPLLAGIVVGLAAMISGILIQLSNLMVSNGGEGNFAGLDVGSLMTFFNPDNLIPPYFLQISIGLYIVEVIFILTATLITIDSGEDKLKQTYEVGKNLVIGGVLYLIVALLSTLVLVGLASIALPALG
jgi:hypothetical protein